MCFFFHNFAPMIFYFSGTGNTRWAAQQLSKATREQLIYIPNHPTGDISPELSEGERIGFCFPVHGWRPPMLVRKFISRLRLQSAGHFTYALCTAGDNIGETIEILEKDLQQVDVRLDAAFSLIMPESYVGLPFMDVDTDGNEQAKKSQATERLREFTPLIVNRTKGVRRLDKGRWPRINSRIIGGFFTRHLITDKPFHVDGERCVKCGLCATVCPVHDILGGHGQMPQWRHDGSCLTCFTCYHHCPQHAIEFGRRTQKKGQYYFDHHQTSDNNNHSIS